MVAARGAVGITALRIGIQRSMARGLSSWCQTALWSVAATLGVTIDTLSRVEAELDNIRVMLNSGCRALSSRLPAGVDGINRQRGARRAGGAPETAISTAPIQMKSGSSNSAMNESNSPGLSWPVPRIRSRICV